VIVAGRRQADEITERHPGVVGLQADLNDVDALANLTSEIRDRFPGLNVLIANAGISQAEDMMSQSWMLGPDRPW
jgi:uncharacterized oxidoreductase